jgi:hypothetical protein
VLFGEEHALAIATNAAPDRLDHFAVKHMKAGSLLERPRILCQSILKGKACHRSSALDPQSKYPIMTH